MYIYIYIYISTYIYIYIYIYISTYICIYIYIFMYGTSGKSTLYIVSYSMPHSNLYMRKVKVTATRLDIGIMVNHLVIEFDD